MYDVSPAGADSSTKVDLSWRVIRLSGNSTPAGQSVTSNGAGGSLAEAIIRLLFGDVCVRAGPFLKFEKTVTWPPENCGSVVVRFHLKTAFFSFGFKTNSPTTFLWQKLAETCIFHDSLNRFKPCMAETCEPWP